MLNHSLFVAAFNCFFLFKGFERPFKGFECPSKTLECTSKGLGWKSMRAWGTFLFIYLSSYNAWSPLNKIKYRGFPFGGLAFLNDFC